MKTILNLLPLTEEERAAFRAAAPGYEHILAPAADLRYSADTATADDLSAAEIILGCPPPEALSSSRNLKWLHTWSAGVDAYLAPGVLPEGVLLTSSVGAYGQSVSEHLFAMLLSLMKNLHLYRDDQRAGIFESRGRALTPDGATVLVAGTGDLGASFARLVKAMGAHTVGLRRDPAKGADGIDEMRALSDLDALLPAADVVALFLPQTPDTVHLMDARRLALMKPDAILLNGGRGSAVDCLALADALAAGRLRAAGLDVTEPEPLPAGHPLWREPRCLLTPHVAGGPRLDVTARRIAAIALENLRRYVAGEPLRNRMN